MTADGKVPFKTCDVNAVNDAQGKVPDVQVVDVHDVLLIVLLVEVAILDVVLLFIDVDVVPIFVVVLLLDDVNFVLPIFDVVLLLDDVDGLFESDVVAFNTVLDVQGDVEVVLCNLLYVIL